jgi:hypothetical protein
MDPQASTPPATWDQRAIPSRRPIDRRNSRVGSATSRRRALRRRGRRGGRRARQTDRARTPGARGRAPRRARRSGPRRGRMTGAVSSRLTRRWSPTPRPVHGSAAGSTRSTGHRCHLDPRAVITYAAPPRARPISVLCGFRSLRDVGTAAVWGRARQGGCSARNPASAPRRRDRQPSTALRSRTHLRGSSAVRHLTGAWWPQSRDPTSMVPTRSTTSSPISATPPGCCSPRPTATTPLCRRPGHVGSGMARRGRGSGPSLVTEPADEGAHGLRPTCPPQGDRLRHRPRPGQEVTADVDAGAVRRVGRGCAHTSGSRPDPLKTLRG